MASDVEALEPLLDEEEACPGGVWSMPTRAVNGAGPESAGEPADYKGVAASAFTLVLSIPALVGSWCWPLLLAGFLGITATAGARQFSHTFSFGVILAVTTNLAQYMAWKAASRRGTHWQVYGPLYLLLASVPLVMADLTRHILLDTGLWTKGASMYRPHCGPVHGVRGLRCLSVTGWLFTIICTYTGFACMITGIMWGSNLHTTIKAAWRDVRRAQGHRT